MRCREGALVLFRSIRTIVRMAPALCDLTRQVTSPPRCRAGTSHGTTLSLRSTGGVERRTERPTPILLVHAVLAKGRYMNPIAEGVVL